MYSLDCLLLFSQIPFLRSVYQSRIANRLQSINEFLYYAPKDGLVVNLLVNNPKVFICGSGAGGTDYYVMRTVFLSTVNSLITRAIPCSMLLFYVFIPIFAMINNTIRVERS